MKRKAGPQCLCRSMAAITSCVGQYLPIAKAGHGVAERPDRLSAIREN
jgi:hypothetical protein